MIIPKKPICYMLLSLLLLLLLLVAGCCLLLAVCSLLFLSFPANDFSTIIISMAQGRDNFGRLASGIAPGPRKKHNGLTFHSIRISWFMK